MDGLNQEKTRLKIIELREKHGYTQTKLANLMGVSRTYYNGIENGTTKITEPYLKTLAEFYKVDIADIAVFSETFNEGLYQGLRIRRKLNFEGYDSMSMKLYVLGKKLETGRTCEPTLYPALKAMGYELEVVDIRDCDTATIPNDMLSMVNDNKIFILKKGIKKVGYWSPTNYFEFEKFITASIKGYINEISTESIKANARKTKDIYFTRDGKMRIRSLPPFMKAHSKMNSIKIETGEELHSIKRQVKEMQDTLSEYSKQLEEEEKNQKKENGDNNNENG